MTSDARQRPAKGRVRLELDQRRAQALHAALSETLNADLIAGDRREAAREVLADLDRRVPGWLETAAIGGEAGYLLAAEAVLRALVGAEEGQYALSALAEGELLRALGHAKPLGATATDVLERMRRERLITRRQAHDEAWYAAAPAGRQFLHRDTSASQDAWAVDEPLALLDLLYADGRGGGDAFLPWVQAVGRLDDGDLAALVEALHRDEFVAVPDFVERRRDWLALSSAGLKLARERWEEASPGRRYAFDRPERPPLPHRRELPIRGLTVEGRSHPVRDHDAWYSCPPAAWLQRSSKTKLWSTLRRDGVVEWRCQRCERKFFVYLQATASDGRPVYRDLASAVYNRPAFRPAGYGW